MSKLLKINLNFSFCSFAVIKKRVYIRNKLTIGKSYPSFNQIEFYCESVVGGVPKEFFTNY